MKLLTTLFTLIVALVWSWTAGVAAADGEYEFAAIAAACALMCAVILITDNHRR